MKCTPLEEVQRQFFDDNGYLVVPNALTEQEVAQLTAVSDRMIEGFERGEHQHYVQRRPGIVQERDFHPLLSHAATLPLVVQLLSPNIHLHTTAIIYKFPQIDTSPASRSWHRDIGITQDLGHDCLFRAGIKVGYCLTDFLPSQSGFTLFAPGSHLFTTPLPIAEGEIDPENVVDLCLNAGDAFLFENRVFHTPAPNLSLHTSKVVLFGYSYRWMGGLQHDMALVRPHGDVLDQVDDIGKQLLGGTCSGLVDWASDQEIAPQTVEWTMQA